MESSGENETSRSSLKRCADQSTSNNPTNKKRGKIKTKHMDPKILELRRIIQVSCGANDLHKAMVAYDKLHLQEGVTMEAQSYYNLLNLCEGLTERGVHVGTPKQPKSLTDEKPNESNIEKFYTDEERKKFAFDLKAEMDSMNLPLNETAYTALVRILCKTGDLNEAETLLYQADGRDQCKPKLRMYSCMISAFCKRADLDGALRIWARMSSIKRRNKTGTQDISIELSEKEYLMLMKCATMVGDTKVMDRVLSELAEDVLVPSLDTTNAIVEWFQSKHSVRLSTDCHSVSALDRIQGIPPSEALSIGPIHVEISSHNADEPLPFWDISQPASIDSSTGVLKSGCLSGKKLQPVALTQDAWDAMLHMNENIVLKGELEEHKQISEFAGGGKGKKRILSRDELDKRALHWEAFIRFLTTEYGSSTTLNGQVNHNLDIVIDGANIGYYKQNFSGAPKHVDYRQIDRVVEHLKQQDKRTLLFLHERHFSKKLMPNWADKIVRKWENDKILYRTPHGSNDDWFWMHAALYCGRGTMVLSNDEMRDHHFQMLAHRSFLRWKERHQVRFDIEGKRVILKYPDVYSRRIQKLDSDSLVIPLPKQGDENRFLDGAHQADDTSPKEETYVCITLKRH
jgi:pentatricopeptide repeat protein